MTEIIVDAVLKTICPSLRIDVLLCAAAAIQAAELRPQVLAATGGATHSAMSGETIRISGQPLTLEAAIGLDEPLQTLMREHLPADMQDAARRFAWGAPERDQSVLRFIVALHAGSKRQPQSEIPRKAPCPCGSGENFMHCCGKDQP